ncbi:hypothetical protein [Nodularia chucula]|uniref:hypothetical protein n=1 Tax=Nodularia chucula TaxID=3093667 RepID=UPI0039C6ADAC
MDIEKQKKIEEAAHNYVLNDYGAAFGQRLYMWEDWHGDDDDTNISSEITLYPPDEGQPYSFHEVVEWDIQTSYIVEEDDEAQEYIVAVGLETKEISGDSNDDESDEIPETNHVMLHVFVEVEKGEFVGVAAEEQ